MLTDEVLSRIEQAGGLGLTPRQVCLILNLNDAVVFDIRFKEALERGEAIKKFAVAGQLYALAQVGKIEAIKLWLEGSGAAQVPTLLSAEERARRIAELTEKLKLT